MNPPRLPIAPCARTRSGIRTRKTCSLSAVRIPFHQAGIDPQEIHIRYSSPDPVHLVGFEPTESRSLAVCICRSATGAYTPERIRTDTRAGLNRMPLLRFTSYGWLSKLASSFRRTASLLGYWGLFEFNSRSRNRDRSIVL